MKESNRDRQNERNEERDATNDLSSNATNEPMPIFLTGDSTLQTPDEDRRDKSTDLNKNDSLSVSNDDLHETKADRLGGSDRAGTNERRNNGI